MKINYDQILQDVKGVPYADTEGNLLTVGEAVIKACSTTLADDEKLSTEHKFKIGEIALFVSKGEALIKEQIEMAKARIGKAYSNALMVFMTHEALDGHQLELPPVPVPAAAAPVPDPSALVDLSKFSDEQLDEYQALLTLGSAQTPDPIAAPADPTAAPTTDATAATAATPVPDTSTDAPVADPTPAPDAPAPELAPEASAPEAPPQANA